MSDDGAPGTTLALRSTNNQINPPGVAELTTLQLPGDHQSPAELDQTQEMCPGWAGLGCDREFADLSHCHCLPIKCLILHLNLKQTGFISDMWPGM